MWAAGDAMRYGDVIGAAAGVSVIVHALNPPGYRHWERLVLPMIDNSIAAARALGGARIVLPGTVSNFDPAMKPLVGEDRQQPPQHRKGRVLDGRAARRSEERGLWQEGVRTVRINWVSVSIKQ